jgi:GNAT superfamily N-acetyltransferase
MLRRPTWLGPSPKMDRKARELSWTQGNPGSIDPTVFARAWGAPNRIKRKTVQLHSRPHNMSRRMNYSFWRGFPLDIVELREGEVLRGRFHLLHNRDINESTLTEIWVPPSCRRRGYGTFLLSVADELAAMVDAATLRLVLNEADASPRARERALSFTSSAGYAWDHANLRRPNILGIAKRETGRRSDG